MQELDGEKSHSYCFCCLIIAPTYYIQCNTLWQMCHIMLVLQRSIHFLKKISNVAPPKGTGLRTHYRKRVREKKGQHPSGLEPTTSWLQVDGHNHCPVAYFYRIALAGCKPGIFMVFIHFLSQFSLSGRSATALHNLSFSFSNWSWSKHVGSKK